MADELFSAPSDLTLVSDSDLQNLEERGVTEFDRINSDDDPTPGQVQYAVRLADDLDRIKAEKDARALRAQRLAEQEKLRNSDQMSALRTRVHGPLEITTREGDPSPMDADSVAEATAKGVTAALVSVFGDRALPKRNVASLSETSKVAPQPNTPTQKLSITASVDIPGVAPGNNITNLNSLGEAFSRKARSIPVSRTGSTDNGHTVATVRNSFEHTIDDRTSPAQVGELFEHLLRPDAKDALVAGGGWCAPSEVRYDFFNLTCEDGLIDLPTFGVTRGGIRFPVSPSLADAIGDNAFGGFAVPFTNASVPWLWTEADDIATVTGSPNKPCMRVPCPDFDEERLECYGICLTAGNLTDDAYPEATQNTIRLLMAAHVRAMNARLIALMVAASSAPITTGEFAAQDVPVFQQVLSGIDLGATDYRARYGMCVDDVLEVVAPYWVRNVIRADLAWRTGVELLSVTDAEITAFFTDRNLRVQWVNDWQVRGAGQFGNATPMTAWPTQADIMIYAAGTFLHGQGMSLDLGVIRDSVLNAENDFTAAWSEECHLIARVGHESRVYTITFNVNGATSQAAVTVDAFPNL